MKLEKITNRYFGKTEGFVETFDHIVLFTGVKAVFLDKSLENFRIVDKLDRVYCGMVSPDGKKLLLPSICNCFYIIDLCDLSVSKTTLHAPYNGNLETRAMWSRDGSQILTVASYGDSVHNILRVYNAEDTEKYEDFDPFGSVGGFVSDISYIPSEGKYLMKAVYFGEFKKVNIFFDGKKLEKKSPECKTNAGIPRCSPWLNGRLGEKLRELLNAAAISEEKRDGILSFISEFYFDPDPSDDIIYDALFSQEFDQLFVGTKYGLFVFDTATGTLVLKKRIPDSVVSIHLPRPDRLFIGTLCGSQAFRME